MSEEETGGEEGRVEVALDNKFHTKVVNYSVSSQVCRDKYCLSIKAGKGSAGAKITNVEISLKNGMQRLKNVHFWVKFSQMGRGNVQYKPCKCPNKRNLE